jgi:hypothetical protein
LPFRQDALGKGINLLPIKGLTPLDRHIDILDCNDLLLHHLCCSWPKLVSMDARAVSTDVESSLFSGLPHFFDGEPDPLRRKML